MLKSYNFLGDEPPQTLSHFRTLTLYADQHQMTSYLNFPNRIGLIHPVMVKAISKMHNLAFQFLDFNCRQLEEEGH